jgi:hypothetical protein
MQRLLSHSGLGPAALPISMAAAALVGLLLPPKSCTDPEMTPVKRNGFAVGGGGIA